MGHTCHLLWLSMINWTKTDLNTIDTKTRNLMRKFHIVHNKTNVERLYLPRNEGGRGLISLWKHYQKTIVNVVHYLHRNSDSRFIKLFLKWDENRGPTLLTLKAKKYAEEANLPFDQLLEMEKDKCKEKLKSTIIQRDKAAVTNMPLHGQFQTHLHSDHIDKKTSLLWLKDGRLKGHTKSEIFTIQYQAVKTKYIEKHIYSTREDDKCSFAMNIKR